MEKKRRKNRKAKAGNVTMERVRKRMIVSPKMVMEIVTKVMMEIVTIVMVMIVMVIRLTI